MREVEVKTALSHLWDGPSLPLGKNLKRRELESNGRFSFYFFAVCDLSPMRNTVKKFLMADLVVYRAPLSCHSGDVNRFDRIKM